MKKFVYNQLPELEKKYWWYLGRKKILKAIFNKYFIKDQKRKILDGGCGAGSVMEFLSEYGETVGVDNNPEIVKYCQTEGKNVILAELKNLPFADKKFDYAVLLEVLEHTENDLAALKEVNRVLKKNGLLLLSVPAFPVLWGNQDLAAGHKRRYTKRELESKIKDANFQVVMISYMNFIFFPFIFVFRTIRKRFFKEKPQLDTIYFHNNFLNNILSKVLAAESLLISRLNVPFGVTLICLVRK